MRSPVTRKLVAFIFIAILLVEIVIQLPLYQRKEKELLGNLARTSEHSIHALFYAFDRPEDYITNSLAILQSPIVAGIKIIDRQGEIVVASGERFIGEGDQLTSKYSYRSADGNRYEAFIPATIPYKIFVRLDSSSISAQLRNYVFHIFGQIVLITAVLTLATLIGAGVVVLRPLLGLRDPLCQHH